MTAYMISAEKAWIAMQFVSTDEARLNLQGFLVVAHKDGALIVSTDGIRGVVLYDADAVVPETAIIRLNKETVRALKKGERLKIDNGQAQVLALGDVAHIQPGDCRIDGDYVDWRPAFRSAHEPSGVQSTYNAKYLGQFGALNGPITKFGAIAVEMNGENPARITTQHHDRYGILMPVRATVKGGDWTRDMIEIGTA